MLCDEDAGEEPTIQLDGAIYAHADGANGRSGGEKASTTMLIVTFVSNW